MKNYHDQSLWELALSVTWFDPLIVAHDAWGACFLECFRFQAIVDSSPWCVVQLARYAGSDLILGLTLRGVAPATRRVTRNDNA